MRPKGDFRVPRIRDRGEDAPCRLIEQGSVAANDGEFRLRGTDSLRAGRLYLCRGLLLLVALGVIAGLAYRIEGGDAERDMSTGRLTPGPCLTSFSQHGWRNPEQYDALCARTP